MERSFLSTGMPEISLGIAVWVFILEHYNIYALILTESSNWFFGNHWKE